MLGGGRGPGPRDPSLEQPEEDFLVALEPFPCMWRYVLESACLTTHIASRPGAEGTAHKHQHSDRRRRAQGGTCWEKAWKIQ